MRGLVARGGGSGEAGSPQRLLENLHVKVLCFQTAISAFVARYLKKMRQKVSQFAGKVLALVRDPA